jgi:hypothetical protein
MNGKDRMLFIYHNLEKWLKQKDYSSDI